jgi:hypothetical protein
VAWLRIDDRVRTHPKIAEAGPAAAWLWFCGVCYCREHLTDGVIHKSVLASLAMNLTQPVKHAERLVAVGLWHETDNGNGYTVHDFLDWNPSRAEVETARKADLERKRNKHGVPADSERNLSGFQTTPSRDRAGALARARDLVSGSGVSSEESARETDDFAAFWAAYPRRVGKDAARKAFDRRRSDVTLDAVLAALALQTASQQWQRDGGRYVPHPATWLNQGRWQDEVDTSGSGLSSDEWEAAAEIRRKSYGRCPHEQPCASYDECVTTIGLARRSGAA